MAEDDFILWTYQAAPWADAAAFLADLKKDATGMRFGGSQSKDVDQTLSLLLGKQVGGKLTYIPFKSGSEASHPVGRQGTSPPTSTTRRKASASGAAARSGRSGVCSATSA
ncbi:tricarboxylate transporter [Pseudomonas aeruginosa]|nr:tricarboxylate transporter [Pseudomonas aeruginosa]